MLIFESVILMKVGDDRRFFRPFSHAFLLNPFEGLNSVFHPVTLGVKHNWLSRTVGLNCEQAGIDML